MSRFSACHRLPRTFFTGQSAASLLKFKAVRYVSVQLMPQARSLNRFASLKTTDAVKAKEVEAPSDDVTETDKSTRQPKESEGTVARLDDRELVESGSAKAHELEVEAERESQRARVGGAEAEPWVKLDEVVFPPELMESTDEALWRGEKLYELRRRGWEEPEDIVISALRRAKLV